MKLLIILSSLSSLILPVLSGTCVCKCIIESTKSMIWGLQIPRGGSFTDGQEAEPNQFPYQVGLISYIFDSSFFCSGTLLSDQWILTAAHCVQFASEIKVILGTITADEEDGKVVKTSTYFVHENFGDPIFVANDIALVKLESPVELSDSIQPASLPDTDSSSYEDENAISSGWGADSLLSSSESPTLRYMSVPVIPDEECQEFIGMFKQDSMICIEPGPDDQITCFGDSGGPLVLEDTSTLIGVAVVGSSYSCISGYPAVFMRVTSYIDWIKNISDI